MDMDNVDKGSNAIYIIVIPFYIEYTIKHYKRINKIQE